MAGVAQHAGWKPGGPKPRVMEFTRRGDRGRAVGDQNRHARASPPEVETVISIKTDWATVFARR
jgi:hypothetical protein